MSKKKDSQFGAAIHEASRVSIAELRPHPKNYREHPQDQLDHIKASLDQHGLYRNVVVAKDGTILAGHGVVEAARDMGMKEVLVIRLDIEPDSNEALKLLAGDNYISRLAIDDDRALSEILKRLNDADDLEGTGFDEQMLAAFAMVTRHKSEIADHNEAAEWVGMPEYDSGELEVALTIRFDSASDREKFLETVEFGEDDCLKRTDKQWSVWWPLRERNDITSVEFASADDGAA